MDRDAFSHRRGRHFGASAAERFCQRISDFSGRVQGRHFDRRAGGRAIVGGDCRSGADRRSGGGLFHQGLRHRFSRRTAERTRIARARSPAPAMRLPMLVLAAGCVLIGLARAVSWLEVAGGDREH